MTEIHDDVAEGVGKVADAFGHNFDEHAGDPRTIGLNEAVRACL
jgi:hypothetical protein